MKLFREYKRFVNPNERCFGFVIWPQEKLAGDFLFCLTFLFYFFGFSVGIYRDDLND